MNIIRGSNICFVVCGNFSCFRARHHGRVVNVQAQRHSADTHQLGRRHALLLPSAFLLLNSCPAARAEEGTVSLIQLADVSNLSGYLRQVLEYNQRIQRQNNAPKEFPSFVRDKFDITIVAEGYSQASNGVKRHLATCKRKCTARTTAPRKCEIALSRIDIQRF